MTDPTPYTVTIADPDRKLHQKGRCTHLINNVPNTEANREFWKALGKECRKSRSIFSGVRLRGRGHRENNHTEEGASDQSSVHLNRASHFSVYLIERKLPGKSPWLSGYESGIREVQPLRDKLASVELALERTRSLLDESYAEAERSAKLPDGLVEFLIDVRDSCGQGSCRRLTVTPALQELVDKLVPKPEPVEVWACQNCEWRGPEADTDVVLNAAQRFEYGGRFTGKQCPECRALCWKEDTPVEAMARKIARSGWAAEGSLEIDDGAQINTSDRSDDCQGFYVESWVYVEVTNEEIANANTED